jgi:hypothetical protein
MSPRLTASIASFIVSSFWKSTLLLQEDFIKPQTHCIQPNNRLKDIEESNK